MKKTHGVQLLVRAIVRDPDGKVITDTGQKPAKSFVIQFLEFIYFMGRAIDAGFPKATDTVGAETLMYYYENWPSNTFLIKAPLANDDYGTVIGTGDTAVSNTDYKLQTQLTEGEGAGNISHGAQTVEAAAEVGANVDIVLKRSFTNLTGSEITVKEAGIYTSYVTGFHCIVRDVLSPSVDVPDACSLTIIYTVRTTV